MSAFAHRQQPREASAPAQPHRPAEPRREAPPPPHDPELRPTARGAAEVHRHYAEEREEEEDSGFFGSIGRLARRVTRTAQRAVQAAVPAVVHTATSVVEQVRHSAEAAVSESAQAVTQVAEQAVETTTRVVQAADRVRRDVARTVRESDVGSQVLRVHDEMRVLEASLVEEAIDLGEGVAEYVDEDLAGNGPDLTVAPDAPSLPIEEAQQTIAVQRAHDLFTATDGLGTDFTAVRTALTGMSPAQIQVIEQEYWDMTDPHQNLRAMLDLETSGSDGDEVTGLLSGDPVTQAVATLRGATTGADTEDEVVRATLRTLDPAQMRAVRRQLGDQFFRDQLAGTSEEASLARVGGDEIAAQAIEVTDALQGGLTGSLGRSVGVEGMGADLATANQVLGEIPEEGRAAYRTRLETAVAERSEHDQVEGDQSLTQMIETATEPGAERDLTVGTLEGDQTAIDAAQLALNAEDHWYENPAVITGALMVVCPVAGLAYAAYRLADSAQAGRNPMETADVEQVRSIIARRPGEDADAYRTRMTALETRFSSEYGGGEPHALRNMIDEEFTEGSSDHAYLTDLQGGGVVSPEAQLRYAFEGHLGTDNQLAMDALRDENGQPLPRTEINRIIRASPGLREQVDGGVLSEMSGDDGFEMRELLHGAPENDAERIEAELRRDEWARGWGVARPLVELTGSQSARVMDRQREELVRLRGELNDEDNLSDEEQVALRQALNRHGTAETAYRERVDEVTEGTATVVGTATAITAGIIVDAMTLGAATPVLLALAGAAGGLADLGTRLVLQGGRLSNEEIAQRLASTALNAATAGTGLNGVTGALVSAGADEALQIGTGQNRIEDLGDVGALGLRLGAAAGTTALGDHLASGIDNSTLRGRVGRGVTSGLVQGGIRPLADVRTYGRGLEGAMQTIGTSIATNVGSNVVSEVASYRLQQLREQNAVPQPGGTDARDLLATQNERGAEVALAVDPEGQVVQVVGTSDGVSVPDEHVGIAHTHPNASEDPRMMLPSDGQGNLASVRQHGNTQVVVHDEGVTVFHPGSSSEEVPGLVGESQRDVGRNAQNVTIVPSTQVLVDHDGHDVLLWPSPDNPEQGMLPVQFPDGPVYAPGTGEANVQALAEHQTASNAEAQRVAAESAAAETDVDPRPVIGRSPNGLTVYHEGDELPAIYRDTEGRIQHRAESPAAPVPDAADEFRAELVDPSDPDFVPSTRDEASRVRAVRGGLPAEPNRQQYQDTIASIPGEVDALAADGASLEDQARRASDIRHEARMVARGLDEDQLRAANQDLRDVRVYGRGEGPNFDDSVAAARRALIERGQAPETITNDDVHREVIAMSQRTDAETNQAAGVSGQSSRRQRETADTLIDEMLAQHRREISEPYAD